MRRAAAALVVAIVVACSPIASRTMQLEAPGVGDVLPVRTTITDTTGRLVDAAFVAPGRDVVVQNVQGHPDRIQIAWLGGMCDRTFEVAIGRSGERMAVAVTTTSGMGGCRMAGIQRTLELTFSQPVAAEAVDVTFDVRPE